MNSRRETGWEPEGVLGMCAPTAEYLPRRLLYATSSGLGGTGLNSTSLEGVAASAEQGFLAEALCFGGARPRLPGQQVTSLNLHPVRALSFLESREYYAAKKRYVAWVAERRLRKGGFDCFHGWSGDAFRALIEARRRGIPSVLDIPTWHRNKGVSKSGETRSEREDRLAGGSSRWFDLEIRRVQMLAEYDLADLLLMPSRKSAETFLAAGVPAEKLHYVARGVDPQRYRPGTPPEIFRVCFVGALICRKGVHLLLEAWHKLALKDAELLLVGTLHPEMKDHLAKWNSPSVKLLGFTPAVQDELRRSAVFAFPSECEGFAKATIEAAACGLPLIATQESGDAVVDGETGIVVAAGDTDVLAAAIEHAHKNRDAMARMGLAARQRVERCLTWDHYRLRLLQGYARVTGRHRQ